MGVVDPSWARRLRDMTLGLTVNRLIIDGLYAQWRLVSRLQSGRVSSAAIMKTVQLAIRDSDYAQSLRNLLLRDGTHRVYLVDQPNLRLDGVVVIDENRFQNLASLDTEPERFVVVTRKGADNLSRVWEAGIRHVVFEEDSPNTTQLAIIAAELRLPRDGAVSKMARPVEH
jgi:hypothetical protein